jgi:hypothetical protein
MLQLNRSSVENTNSQYGAYKYELESISLNKQESNSHKLAASFFNMHSDVSASWSKAF